MKVVLINMTKKALACFLAVIIAIPLISVPTTAYGATFNDVRGHWAESYINKAVASGFAKGYPDGTFKPDKAVSRAEFTSMVNKALGNNGSTSVNFSDVPYNEWYYNDIAKGISAAFVGGYDNNTFKPNTAVTREEAAVMVSRFVPTYGSSSSISSFKDRSSISTWATDAVAKIYSKGYMGAYNDGKYHPQDSLTRAQTAKILCSIVAKENIASSSTIVKSKGSTLSNRIYSNNVTMHSDLGSGDADLSNCVVLGTLYVYGGGENTITVSNSRVANAFVEKSSSSVRVLAKGQTVINKTTTGKEAILETSGLSGGLYGTGFNDVDIKSSADTTLKGSFIKVNVIGSSADVEIESGSITTFNVTSSGRSSDINLNSKANIGTANVNSGVAFRGSGSINTMNVNSSGVTYETKPRYVKLGSGISSTYQSDSNSDFDIEVNPKNGAKDVDIDDDITLTFDTAVTRSNGSSIRNSDIDDMVYLRKGSSSGTKISFSGSISSNKRVITLDPNSDLDEDTKYYVVIHKNEFYDTHDKGNDAQTTYFTTDDDSDGSIKFYPKSGYTGVSQSIDPTITFPESIETYSGKSITSSYLEDTIIFREGSSSGSRVSFDASINSSKKVITIDPDHTLKEGQKYYISIPSRKFRTQSKETSIGSESVTWTTSSGSAPTVSFNPSNGSNNIALTSNVTLNFSSSIYDTSGRSPYSSYISSYVTLRNNTTNANVPYSLYSFSNSSNGASMVLKPSASLTAGHNYTILISSGIFKNSSGTYMGSASSSFTAAGSIDKTAIDAAISNANTAKSSVRTSANNGSDIYTNVYWVTQAQWDALNSAITVATNAKGTVATTAQAQTVAATLNTAVSTFNAAKQAGSKVIIDTKSISDALTNAENALKNTAISTDGFDISQDSDWVTKEVMSAFNTAINTAKEAINTVESENQAFTAAMDLDKSTTEFIGHKDKGKKANKTGLISEIKSARSYILSVPVSSDGSDIATTDTWVKQGAKDNYAAAIYKAGGIEESSTVTQEAVDNELNALKDATDAFTSAIQSGTKVETPAPEGGQ